MFSHFLYELVSNYAELSLLIYIFKIPDTMDGSLSDTAYHSWDILFFFHLPAVPGQAASREKVNIENSFCESAITLAYGEQPWEPFILNNMIMSFAEGGS